MTQVTERLTAALSGRYRIERKLGEGGMATVYLADDVKHNRKVAVKVLRPELAASLGPDRFLREIEIAAGLAHPHILPVYDSGEADGLLYYVMPYVDGESLRETMAREGALPIAKAVHILREVVDALSAAHERGVIHRDIKPDNVMITRDHAQVTDFGVAKAVSEAAGRQNLTTAGVALGTPSYMSPEQATADPHVDHRADIYAVGVLAYEMLAGRPPFLGSTQQQIIAAHLTRAPDPVRTYRDAIPEALDALVMRCLAKGAADRWQTAAEMKVELEAIALTVGEVRSDETRSVGATPPAVGGFAPNPRRVAVLFAAGSAAVLLAVYGVMIWAGLPDWVFPAAVVLLVLGLPVILLTGHHERQRAELLATGATSVTPAGLARHFRWRKALIGGVLAFAGLGVITAGFMASRVLGIGPAGTLVSSGALAEQTTILLADFTDRTRDSLGIAATEAFRVDLAQSTVVRLLPDRDLANALARMQRNPRDPLDRATALEVGVREGVGAIVTGEINAAGSGYVLTAELVEPGTENLLAAVRQTAVDGNEIIPAINQLSRDLRERIGESYKAIRSQPRLDRVSTSSLDALRSYSAGIRAEKSGDDVRAVELFQAAIDRDTAFAMAYRKLSVILFNTLGSEARRIEAGTRAFEYRDRLPELERHQVTVYYYASVAIDRPRAIAAGYSALERYPDDPTLLVTLALTLNRIGRFEEAEPLARRGREYGRAAWTNLIAAQLGQGEIAAAESTVTEFDATFPGHPSTYAYRSYIAQVQGDYAAAFRERERRDRLPGVSLALRSTNSLLLGVMAMTTGQLQEADDYLARYADLEEQRGNPGNVISAGVRSAWIDLLYRGGPEEALRRVEDVLARHPLDSLAVLDRPYAQLAELYATAGQTDEARRLLDDFERLVPEAIRRGVEDRYSAMGALALAEGRFDDAIGAFRARNQAGDRYYCTPCGLFKLGDAYEAAGQPDSAIAVWERAVSLPSKIVPIAESQMLARAFQGLGELYEERGNDERAIDYYNRLVELWTDADEELQPQVDDMRRRIARLVAEGR